MSKKLKWPRGRYNGKRIVGIRISLTVNVRRWHVWLKRRHLPYSIALGPVRGWVEPSYESEG